MSTDTKYLVKLYSFGENLQWDDLGTGRVSLTYLERLQGLAFIIHSENASILLESKILMDREYQKQEETLIIWNEDGVCDVAVSFIDKAGCDEIWHKICKFQGKDSSFEPTQDITGSDGLGDTINDSIVLELPPCELGNLENIQPIITTHVSTSSPLRDSLTLALETDNYMQKLIDLFTICEDLEDCTGLHYLYTIFRSLFLLNKPSILTIMFLPQNIMNVIGALEYNPSKPHIKHREYLDQTSQHREIIPFNNPGIMEKIHLTYKMCYIQEVILPTPSLFEENLMSAFNSLILFNKTDIVNAIQEDSRVLNDLFSNLSNDSIPVSKYRDYALFLRELCSFAQALEMERGTDFYVRMCNFDLMTSLEQMLTCEVEDIVNIAIDIINQIGDYNSSILRDHILKQNGMDEDSQFLNVIIGLLVDAEFTSIDVQLVGLIRSLIVPENIVTETAAQTAEKALFLNYFYEHCMHRLLAPLMAQTTGEKISKDTAQNAVLLGHILELLSLCVERHSHYICKYIIERNLLGRVLVLMTSFHRHLTLAALRFCRRIVGLKDEFYNRYIIKHNLFSPIIKSFMANGQRYNLVNSAIIELFEFIKAENIKTLITYTVENFMDTLESVEYVNTFKGLKLKYDQGIDNSNSSVQPLKGVIWMDMKNRFRRDPRELDEEEESWFDEEEESTVVDTSPPSPPLSLSTLPRILTAPNNNNNSMSYSPRPPLTRSPLHSPPQIKLPTTYISTVSSSSSSHVT
jgi:protein phosphatase-4 regulatory subunit 3